jgi:hypothetical protein
LLEGVVEGGDVRVDVRVDVAEFELEEVEEVGEDELELEDGFELGIEDPRFTESIANEWVGRSSSLTSSSLEDSGKII